MRKRRKLTRPRYGMIFLLMLLCLAFLVSCMAGSDLHWIRGVLGIGNQSYRSEPATATLERDAEPVRLLSDKLVTLAGNGVTLKPFSGASNAVRLYRDEILNAILLENYSEYIGNSAVLSSVRSTYPQLNVSTLIPERILENAVARDFGEGKVSHRNGGRFCYLSRAGVYSLPTQPVTPTSSVEITLAEETAHTYRLYFTLLNGEERSEEYLATFVKREEACPYLDSIREIK